MQNLDKTQNSIFALADDKPSIFEKVGSAVWLILPGFIKVFSLIIFALILQALLVGLLDRAGMSPKVSFISTSLIYILTFGGLAVWGGIKPRSPKRIFVNISQSEEPICKILTVRRKTQGA